MKPSRSLARREGPKESRAWVNPQQLLGPGQAKMVARADSPVREIKLRLVLWAMTLLGVAVVNSTLCAEAESVAPAASRALAGSCTEVQPDMIYRCPGNAVNFTNDKVTYQDLANDDTMASNPDNPTQAGTVIVSTSALLSGFNWATMDSVVSPNLKYILSGRFKSGCTTQSCSFGRVTMWLDRWDPVAGMGVKKSCGELWPQFQLSRLVDLALR
jgi:hypothetical protein